MSVFGDYKAYKKYEPEYSTWKYKRDYADAQRQKFLTDNNKQIPNEDIQRGKALLRAIDVMDDYSQKRAEDIEVATETAVGYGTEAALLGGGTLGYGIAKIPKVQNFLIKNFGKNRNTKQLSLFFSIFTGVISAVIAAFPLYAWAAKVEVSASRKGRFEAMRKELKNPKAFAILTDTQRKEVEQIKKEISTPKDKNTQLSLGEGIKKIKEFLSKHNEYNKQRYQFELDLAESQAHIEDKMTPAEIEKAKKEQQLLTKLVEKIDIASQDYAENIELASSAIITSVLGLGTLFSIGTEKILKKMNIKSANKVSAITNILGGAGAVMISIIAAQLQKNASKVGRFKVKQELLNNPKELAYVPDEDINNINDVQVSKQEKKNIFKFLMQALKDSKEYKKYKKTTAKEEDKYYKALDKIELSEEQLKDAKTLQRNTFRTFNKVDEKSQKYSESIEALGQAIGVPIAYIFGLLGSMIGLKYIIKTKVNKNVLQEVSDTVKYMGIILLSTIPSIGFNAYITKQQKKASRIADMLAINEMSDYRLFK